MAARRGPELATQQLRREAVERLLLADPATSNRKVATAATVDPTTVATVRRELETNGRIPPRIPPVPTGHGGALLETTPGNTRAVRHGAWSEQKVAPLRAQHLDALRREFPAVDERLLIVQAQRLAQLELLTAWTDANGVVKGRGDVFRAAEFAERLARQFEAQHEKLTQLQREAVQVDPQAALTAHLRELQAGEAA